MPLDYYGFSDRPFELSPDLKFLYLPSGYRTALEAVVRGIMDNKGLVVLTGEVGSGKTMLLYGVMEKLPPRVKTAFIFHSTYNFEELLQQIYYESEEELPAGGITELKKNFLRYLIRLRDRGELLAILIDEAQKLSEEVFQGLFSLLEAEPWVPEILQVVLVGQPELESTFQTFFSRCHPKITPLRIKINPFSREESLEYIAHRLRKVGRSAVEIFSPQSLSLIVEKAEGIPRVINIICDNALFSGSKDSVRKIEVNLIESVLGNLEGPDYQPTKKRKPPSQVTPFRLSYRLIIRDGLIVVFGVTLVVGLFLLQPELTWQLKSFKWFGEPESLLNQKEKASIKDPSPRGGQANVAEMNPRSDECPKPGQEKSPQGQPQSSISSPLLVRSIQVKEGDYLSKLIAGYYGKLNESLIDLVLNYNPSIKNIDLVLVNQLIRLPELKEETLIFPVSGKGPFSIHLGTFPGSNEAHRFRNQLLLNRQNLTVKSIKVSPRQTWFRVEAASYGSKNEALEVIKKLRERKLLPLN